ncbi:MAG: adenylate-forming protein, partial [Propionibacteriaceae bacterium]|nr:adenylate-forming protein [Propionibacteriaceae bacterium]
MATSTRVAGSARTVALILAVLAYRRRLRRRDQWSRAHLLAHQQRALAILRAHAYERSSFYRDFHAGLTDASLAELPVLTKQMLMANLDRLATRPEVRLVEIEAY